jgi:hypothetical protein
LADQGSYIAEKKASYALLKEADLNSWLAALDLTLPFLLPRVQNVLKEHHESCLSIATAVHRKTFAHLFLLLLGPHKGALTLDMFPDGPVCVEYTKKCLAYEALDHLHKVFEQGAAAGFLQSTLVEYENEVKDLPVFLKAVDQVAEDLNEFCHFLEESLSGEMLHFTLKEYEKVWNSLKGGKVEKN